MSSSPFHIPEVRSRWRLARYLVPALIILFGLLGHAWYQASHLVQRALQLSWGAADYQHGWVQIDWRGDVHVSNIVRRPAEAPTREPIRAERMQIETPGWDWYLGNLLHGDRLQDRMRRVRIRFEGLQVPDGLDPSLGELGPFAATASPFDTEGCLARRHWTHADLGSMELEPGVSTLDFRFSIKGETLETRIVLLAPGLSKVELTRLQRLADQPNVLLSDQFPRLTVSETWAVEDLGFIRARNRYCAQREHLDQRVWIDQHVRVVERLLQTIGLQVDAATRSAYRAFVRDGGELGIELRYQPPLAAAELFAGRASGQALASASPVLQRKDQSISAEWTAIPVRPLAGWSAGMASADAWRQEQRGLAGNGEHAPAESSHANYGPKQTVRLDLSGIDLGLVESSDPRGSFAGEQPPSSATSTSSGQEAVRESSSAAEPTVKLETGAAEQTAAAAAKPNDNAASTESADKQRRIESLVVVPTYQPKQQSFGWNELPQHIGKRMRIDSVAGGSRVVELIAIQGDELQVRARMGGGMAEFRIRRSSFKSARLL